MSGVADDPAQSPAGEAVRAAFEHGEHLAALPVRFLFEFQGWPTDTPGHIVGGPKGERFLFHVLKGRFAGPNMAGEIVVPSGDWATVRPGGLILDVRLALRTDDGSDILMNYQGLIVGRKIHVAGLFEAGTGRYSWLNTVQYVGVGRFNEDGSLSYMFYELA
jgi:hypothetical protein